MNMRLVSSVLAHPIERIRGGMIALTLECVFESEGAEVTTFGFALVDKEGELEKAAEEALTHATDRAQKLLEQYASNTNGLLFDALAATADEVVIPAMERKKAAGGLTQEQFEKLEAPTDDTKQRELDQLCETLGIPKVDTAAKEWPMKATIAVIAALKKMARRLEDQG